MKRATAFSVSILILAAVVTAVLMARAAAWNWRPHPLLGWAVAPYVVLSGYVFLRSRHDPGGSAARASRWMSMAALLYTSWVYLDASFVHRSSTSALVFVVAPLALLVGGPLLAEILIWFFRGKALHGR